jgi:hypothetical protein
MRTDEAIRHMCETVGKGTTVVSKDIGRGSSFVGSILSRGSVPKADTLARIAEACGYELVLRGHGEEITIEYQ